MKVQRTEREVIERKLLTALSDDGVVAVILSRDDLEDLIAATKTWPCRDSRASRLSKLRIGLQRLLDEAFDQSALAAGGE